VVLTSDVDTDFTAYEIALDTLPGSPREIFDESGRAVLRDAAPGSHVLGIFTPDGARYDLSVDLRMGDDWRLEVPIDTPRKVAAYAVPSSTREIPSGGWITAFFWSAGAAVRYRKMDAEGRAVFACITGDEAVFSAFDSKWTCIGTTHVKLGAGEQVEVPVPLDGADYRVRVLDTAGEPAHKAFVAVTHPGDRSGWYAVADPTNADGLTTIPGMTASRLLVSAQLASGESSYVLADFDNAERLAEVRVDASWSLCIVLRDHDAPAGHVEVSFRDQIDGLVRAWLETSEAGTATLRRINEASFVVGIEYPGYFPVSVRLKSTPSPELQEIQVRRTGALLADFDRSGLALTDARLELHSVEYDCSIEPWLAQGKIAASPADLSADREGRLRIDGLPHGAYSWTAALSDGASQSGRVTVEPGSATTLRVSF